MRSALAVLLALAALVLPPAANAGIESLQRSVVKIYGTYQRDDFGQPWQSTPVFSGSGSGFILPGRRILSNAHVVSDARFIEVQREGDPQKYQASVLFAGHDCDLAILTVKNETFFDGTAPVKFGREMPSLNDAVLVLGYPMGGARISLTKGVVSRIDYNLYSHSTVDSHLVMQVDAAINPGNSGGPVLFDGKVIGVAFQGIMGAQNIGYAIPLPVIQHFLKDTEDGVYDGYPELGVVDGDTRNPALRADLGIANRPGGVAVAYVDPFGAATGRLLPRDVLLSVDGHPIAEDGSVRLDGNVVEYTELVERKQVNEKVSFEVWRAGKPLTVTLPLVHRDDPFVFRQTYDRHPEYFIAGGLVFTPLSRGFLTTLGADLNSPAAARLLYYSQYAKLDGLYTNREQFVVLATRLPNPVNTYCDGFMNQVVATVNGHPIGRLEDLPGALQTPTNGFHVIRFEGNDNPLIVDARLAKAADSKILRQYNVPTAFYVEQGNAP